ncbi:hypothetical protein [Aquimarina sediminis]|uniref:hypothetical protein n=1 Tax=Aquimarina sediminis TaxID=2070536 RepID=UPI000CA0542D|nr:hypothetical protein [Aquimarina sediminis]
MKKFLLLSTIFILTTNCSVSKKLKFEYVDNIEVKNIDLNNITLNADAVFNNPNNLRGTLSIDDMHIFVDNIDVGTVSSQEFKVPQKSEFSIPLEGTISLSKVYKENKNNLLGSILKVVQTDSLKIRYKGAIKYHLGSFSYPYSIDKEQMVRLK